MNPVRMTPTRDGGSRTVTTRDHLRRDEARPVRSFQPLPCWEKRVAYVLDLAATRGRVGLRLPLQWTTHNGSPRCVRCGWPATDTIDAGVFPLPVCDTDKCVSAVQGVSCAV